MIRTRPQLEAMEDAALAPWAQRVALSAGRSSPEAAHAWRTDYQRDRARIIHSRAFRRLEYKTQVFLNGTGDHLRTRLTHTLEVSSIARAIATALGLNTTLAETIALAHDLGHAPVGHAGEEVLDELMQGHGGFEHNQQSLRVVTVLESKYPDIPGLNLTWEVREGLQKHEHGLTRPAFPGHPEETFPCPSLEAQITNLADEIAYYSHDLDDGLEHALITEEQLEAVELWQLCATGVRARYPDMSPELFRRSVVRNLIDYQVEQLVECTAARIQETGVDNADAVRRQPALLAGYDATMRRRNAQLRRFLYQNLYHHPAVSGLNARGCTHIRTVFQHVLAHPGVLPDGAAARIPADGLHRSVCDYISGFTDRYLLEESGRITAAGG